MGCSSSKDAVADQAKRESQPVAEQAPIGTETLDQEAKVVQKSPMSALETGTAMYMRLYPENSNDGSEYKAGCGREKKHYDVMYLTAAFPLFGCFLDEP
jgi:hypothetical protein